MKDRCKELKLDDNITFTGHIPHENIVEYFQKLSVFIAVSTRESFGVSILEAAACGVPAVTSNVGGLPEVNKDKVTGFLIQPNNASLLAEKILKLYENDKLWHLMSNNARKRVVKLFDWDLSVDQMKELYKKYQC